MTSTNECENNSFKLPKTFRNAWNIRWKDHLKYNNPCMIIKKLLFDSWFVSLTHIHASISMSAGWCELVCIKQDQNKTGSNFQVDSDAAARRVGHFPIILWTLSLESYWNFPKLPLHPFHCRRQHTLKSKLLFTSNYLLLSLIWSK